MKTGVTASLIWKVLFFSIVTGYCLYYAPYGINETDDGFLTGLAWQVLQGKQLYGDIIYVRPPFPVWHRAAQLMLLPDQWSILGERWLFYWQIALYSWLGAAVLTTGVRRWQLALLGFIVSTHSNAPASWHTNDGILLAVLSIYLAQRRTFVLSGVALAGALLCKQSFWPLAGVFPWIWLWHDGYARMDWKALLKGISGMAVVTGSFYAWLVMNGVVQGFVQMNFGAAQGGQAFQHGILDYFRITPAFALPSIIALGAVGWHFSRKTPASNIIPWVWRGWLAAAMLSYVVVVWMRQEHTAAFAQSRTFFWLAAALALYELKNGRIWLAAMLSVSWAAAISWGYNLPILLTTPWIWAALEISRRLPVRQQWADKIGWAMLGLLLTFRVGYEFVYRDGRRSEMTYHLGGIFPSLTGIYSNAETAGLYQDLKQLSLKYGPNFKTLPSFPQASFLTKTYPPLPLDWVVNRETNRDNSLIYKIVEIKNPVFFIEKSYEKNGMNQPELSFTQACLNNGQLLEETAYFKVIRMPVKPSQ
ncbi:MAG: hypothetical protein IT269_02215 [Saprospiraceae bacterium]|nr:hypothetical protein [Saprospiraceae bacterium]